MSKTKTNSATTQNKRPREARTLRGREDQLIDAAIKLAERQILDGTASSQVIVHFLKLGTTRELLEKERLAAENRLLTAKVESLKGSAELKDLYADAIKAMKSYSGGRDDHTD